MKSKRILLVTGPSGSGKSFIEKGLIEEFGNSLSYICMDKIFIHAQPKIESHELAAPYLSNELRHQDIWYRVKDKSIDFEDVFRDALSELNISIDSQRILIQGVQLRIPVWREAIVAVAGKEKTINSELFVVIPSLKRLMDQRETGSDYQRDHAEEEKCKQDLRLFDPLQQRSENNAAIHVFEASEDALEQAKIFFR